MDPIALRYKQRSERYPDENEAERWHGVALGFYLRTGDVPQEVLQYKALALAGLYARKYREDQPRVPAGNPDGGQWTYDGGSNSQSGGEESDGGGGDDQDDAAQVLPAAYRPGARWSARRGRLLREYSRHPQKQQYDATKDPLLKDGALIGSKGMTDEIRILPKSDYQKLRENLLTDARPSEMKSTYNGSIFERSDGTFFGIRIDKDHGETIDILESPNLQIRNGTKVHQK